MLNLEEMEARRKAEADAGIPRHPYNEGLAVVITKDLPALIDEDRELRKENTKLEAAAAAMREMLRELGDSVAEATEAHDIPFLERTDQIAAALSSTAGVALLERVGKLEGALESIATINNANILNDYGGGDVAWWHDYIRAEVGRLEGIAQEALGK